MNRPPGRLDRWRYRVLWGALGDRGREFVVRNVLEQITEGEAQRARAAALADAAAMIEDALQTAAADAAERARLGLPEPPTGNPPSTDGDHDDE